jgi:hypothetical protein
MRLPIYFFAVLTAAFSPVFLSAQSQSSTPTATMTVACSSRAGERHHCSADTSSGVLIVKSSGSLACLLGKTWGYDTKGVWVRDGCSGDFLVPNTVSAEQINPPEQDSASVQPADQTQKQSARAGKGKETKLVPPNLLMNF